MKTLATIGAAAAFLLLGSPAHACWDGWAATFDDVRIEQAGDAEWNVATARALATWLPRIDALLPSGATLYAEQGYVSVRPSAGGAALAETRWSGTSLEALYDAVAHALPAAPTADASRKSIAPLTVQVLAVGDRARAERYAAVLHERDMIEGLGLADGYYRAGGFPAFNRAVHVIDSPAGMPPVTRVVVGAYLDRGSAEATVTLLRAHGVPAFVRPL